MVGERLRDDERALSPVLGVVILLGITVVLASTIGAFAFKIQADMAGPTPQVSITAEQGIHTSNPTGGNEADVKTVTLTHTNGEPIDTDNLIVTVNRKQAYNITRQSNVGDSGGDAELFPFEDKNGEMKETFALGDSVRIVHGDHSAFVDDPSEDLDQRQRYSNNNANHKSLETPEESELYPNHHHFQDSNDVALHTGDVIRLIYTSESGGGGEVLFEHTVV